MSTSIIQITRKGLAILSAFLISGSCKETVLFPKYLFTFIQYHRKNSIGNMKGTTDKTPVRLARDINNGRNEERMTIKNPNNTNGYKRLLRRLIAIMISAAKTAGSKNNTISIGEKKEGRNGNI
ncbi:hypothetical protein HY031_02600 [Candidatus Gottesmanbacteria bacterium]|nr:hypothetical protein [Candidatus Gottesmanbacteria bacterium]